jgi:hypothetical protein
MDAVRNKTEFCGVLNRCDRHMDVHDAARHDAMWNTIRASRLRARQQTWIA